jgi:hypothetical protein
LPSDDAAVQTDSDTDAKDQVAFMQQLFGKDMRYQLLARDDLRHCCDTKGEVNGMTHHALRARGLALARIACSHS